MKTDKLWLRLSILSVVVLCLLEKPTKVSAVEQTQDFESRRTEIVFLLDTSESMNKQDKERAAIDAIRQMSYRFPSDYQFGFVAYHTKIQTVLPLGSDSKRLEEALDAIQYTGYTNAGEGLTEAVKLFSENKNTAKFIIMLSDGEIDMPNKERKENSRQMYVNAANQAKEKGIKILITAIGTELDSQMHIFDGAELTDGAIYWQNENDSLPQIMERITQERLKIPGKAVGVTDAGGGSIHVKLPANTSRSKVIVTGNTEIDEVTADYSAAKGQVTRGKYFIVLDMERPDSEYADISFQTEDIEGVKANLLTEYSAKPQMNIVYRIEEAPQTEEEIKEHLPRTYRHFADITVELRDTLENDANLWEENFEGQEVTLWINDTPYREIIEQGQIQVSIPADSVEEAEASIEMGQTASVYYIEQPVVEKIEKFPDPAPEQKPDYRPLWIVLILLTVIVLIILFLWIRKRSTTVIYMSPTPKDSEKKLETKNCTYSGRFTMYVVRTRDGRDIPPQTYVLFGKPAGRLTFDKILNSCGLKFGKIGAEDIIFYPGPDHSIILMDQSERCTVMRGTEIMKKGMGYPIFYNEKITISFEDDRTEMEIHYKNLSPGEREKIRRM